MIGRSAVFLAALVAGSSWVVGGCGTSSGETGNGIENTGELALHLDTGGVTLGNVSYQIIGPNGFSRSGIVDLSHSSTISSIISGLPAGNGYTITFTAVAADGTTTCAGSATFNVASRVNTPVTVHLTCREAARTGGAQVSGNLNVCPVVDGLSANPNEVIVGGTIALSGAAHDTNAGPSALTYKWTATSGTFSSATVQNPTFKCTEPGSSTLTLTVSDGDCTDSLSQAVTCTGGPDDFSFVVVGCNRVDPTTVPAGAAPDDFPSTANVAQLNRTFAEVAKLNPLPDYFFMTGDLVMGYTNDDTLLRSELNGWVDLYKASPLFGTKVKLVAITGNHETQNASKISTAVAEQSWLDIMAPYIGGSNGPTAGGPDALPTDQSRFTYSFDHNGTHFVIVNTDPTGKDWTVPVNWINTDVTAARAAGAKHVLAIGHKPAYGWSGAPTDSLLGKGFTPVAYYQGLRDQFWATLENNQAEAMFSAHNHLWTKMRPNNKTWQIIAGNGGSALESSVGTGTGGPNGGPLYSAYFGFTVVNVAAGGPVTIKSYGRDVPSAGYWAPAPEATFPTTIRDGQDITWQ